KAGETYVVFASKVDGDKGGWHTGTCSNTFRLQGNEHVLDALRNKVRGGPPRLVGTVRRSTGRYAQNGDVSGAVVVARSASGQFEAVSDALGRYEIRGITPDFYEVEVSKPGFVPDDGFNHRWSGRLVVDKETNTIGPDKTRSRWSIMIGANSC